ncbi:MAG: hypothetical protein RJB62_71 [Pseudomonadota bacterium]|jgi:hypothetical protein
MLIGGAFVCQRAGEIVLFRAQTKKLGGRVKPGHDEKESAPTLRGWEAGSRIKSGTRP